MIAVPYLILYRIIIKNIIISSIIQFINRWLQHNIHHHIWKQLDYHTISSTIQLNPLIFYLPPDWLPYQQKIIKFTLTNVWCQPFFHKWKNNRTSLLTDWSITRALLSCGISCVNICWPTQCWISTVRYQRSTVLKC